MAYNANICCRNVAGPSRLSTTVIPPATSAARSYATSYRNKEASLTLAGYKQWAGGPGKEYAHPNPSGKAKWLGGATPFPTNPSFRPPPPTSNAIQDRIYQQLLAGKRDLPTLAADYNVSKARIMAIKKLKDVEMEFRRQDLPLQTAFQEGMEPLMDMKSPIDPITRQYSERNAREESRARASDLSHQTEMDEELRFEAGEGSEGAFGEPLGDDEHRRIERTVWEWRDEGAAFEEESETYSLPAIKKHESRQSATLPSYPTSVLPGDGKRAAIRFINRPIVQDDQVAHRLRARAHEKERRKKSLMLLKVRQTSRPPRASVETLRE